MVAFVETEAFKELNVGFALDESLVSETDDSLTLFPSERTCSGFKAFITGNPGHGASFVKDSATMRAHKFLTKAMAFREEQEALLDQPEVALGDVHTLNWTMCEGGKQRNVLPAEIILDFDLRVSPKTPMKTVISMSFSNPIHQCCDWLFIFRC